MSRKVYYGGSWVTTTAPTDNNMAGLTLVPVRTSETVAQTNLFVSTSTSANTMGAWTEMVASTSAEVNMIMLYVLNTGVSGGLNGALADIAIGGIGAEVPIVTSIAIPYSNATSQTAGIELPVNVPAGSRLSIRWQSARITASAATVFFYLYDFLEAVTSPATLTAIGASTGSSTGTALGSTNSSYVQITSSTVEDYRSVILTVTSNDSGMSAGHVTFELGVGAAASEVLVPTQTLFNTTTLETMLAHSGGSHWVRRFIPAGSRLAVRFIDANAATNTGYSAVLLGVPV